MEKDGEYMKLKEEELEEICNGCYLNKRLDLCPAKLDAYKWVTICPCRDCFIKVICNSPCDEMLRWTHFNDYGRVT